MSKRTRAEEAVLRAARAWLGWKAAQLGYTREALVRVVLRGHNVLSNEHAALARAVARMIQERREAKRG